MRPPVFNHKQYTDLEADYMILKAENERLKSDNKQLRNELCLKCGRYRDAHKGACDGCRWKENENEL